jgi:hypothetical protein
MDRQMNRAGRFIGGVQSGVSGTPTFFVNGVRCDRPREVDAMLRRLKDVRRRMEIEAR